MDSTVTQRTILEDVTIEIIPSLQFYRAQTMEERAAIYESWVEDFRVFLRDHRSQDVNGLRVNRVYRDVCSGCGETWETMDTGTACANCGEQVSHESSNTQVQA